MSAITIHDIIQLFKIMTWPLVVLVIVLILRKPLIQFVSELGKRATKLSAFEVSVEFATVPSPPTPWSDPSIYESSNLLGGNVSSTSIMELFRRTGDFPRWHYLVVDIEAGRRWLISRLFLFSVILRYMHNLKCVVFVETRDENRQRFLGIAKPEMVRLTIAQNYPWLDQALVEAWSRQNFPVLSEPLARDAAENIVNIFIEDSRVRKREDPQNQDDWEQLGDQPVWEHTKWLDSARINKDMRGVFYDRDQSQFIDSPETSTSKRTEAILRRQSPFVALVNNKGEFKGLVDRQVLLDKVAERLETDM